MPDHLHLLVQPHGISVSAFVGRFKSKSTRLCWQHGIENKIWQPRFYDHILRQEENVEKVVEYILGNPIRQGLAGEISEYQYQAIVDPWT